MCSGDIAVSKSNFRLSAATRAVRYAYTVAPDLEQRSFSAHGSAELELARPTREIVLHGAMLDIDSATARDSKGLEAAGVRVDKASETISFIYNRELSGIVLLELSWRGRVHRDLRGLYQAGEMGVTQFEASDARRVFPCLDEPGFKAVWELNLEIPERLTAISNGAIALETPIGGGRKRVAFTPTPPLSSYLVAMVFGELSASPPALAGSIPVRTWAVPEKVSLTAFAQQAAVSVLPMLESYFAERYVFGKLDQVGVPDFEAGAMENAGCVTYREVVLLLDEQRAPLGVRKRVAEVITHELAHQWFGNLVTMKWWNDLWLNEAFATWIAYKIVDAWKPGWRMWDDFEQGRQTALRLDALQSTHPIRCEVASAEQATENFDAITYEKGGAMLRMLEGFLGEETFQRGIRIYMQRFRFDNTVADDLWNALAEASEQPVAEIANGWLGRGGYPVVSLSRLGRRMILRQERFRLDPEAAGESDPWIIPLVVRYEDEQGVKRRSLPMREQEIEIELESDRLKWVCGNAGGAGFYRVRYQRPDLRALGTQLDRLGPVEVVALLSDCWALFRSRRLELDDFVELLQQAARLPDHAIAAEVANRLSTLERLCVSDGSKDAFRGWIHGLLAPTLELVADDPTDLEGDEQRRNDRSLLRAALLRSLAGVGRHPGLGADLDQRMRADLDGRQPLDPNLFDTAWLVAARRGDEALFQLLLDRSRTDPDPAGKRRALITLACFEAAPLRTRAIELVLDEQVVAMQDVTVYFSALVENRSLGDELWAFIESHFVPLRARCAAPFLTRRLVEALGRLLDHREQVEALLGARAADFAEVPAAVRQTRENMRLDTEVRARGRLALARWLAARSR